METNVSYTCKTIVTISLHNGIIEVCADQNGIEHVQLFARYVCGDKMFARFTQPTNLLFTII